MLACAHLWPGPVCSATTHTDLELRARSKGIAVKVIHNASIMNAVGACGLQLYRYGEAVSIVFFTGPLVLARLIQDLHALLLAGWWAAVWYEQSWLLHFLVLWHASGMPVSVVSYTEQQDGRTCTILATRCICTLVSFPHFALPATAV